MLTWTENKDAPKVLDATGPDTGSKYAIIPGTGGKYNLTVDGNKVPGKRGTVTAMKAEAEKLEDSLTIPKTEDKQNTDPTPAQSAEETPTDTISAPTTAPVSTTQAESAKPAAPLTPTVEEWKAEADKVSPESSQTADKGKDDPKPAPKDVYTSQEDMVILAIAENPSNKNDPEATSWVKEITVKPGSQDALNELARKKCVVIDGAIGNYYCYLTEKGLARYDELNIDKGMEEVTNPVVDPRVVDEVMAKEEKINPKVKIGTVPLNTFVRFEDGRQGTIVKKTEHEITVDMEKGKANYFTPACPVVVIGVSEVKAVETHAGVPVKQPKKKVVVRIVEEEAPDPVRSKYEVHGIPVVVREAPEGGKQRVKVFGISITAILRFLGNEGFTLDEVRLQLKKLKLKIGEQTILSQYYAGNKMKNGGTSKRGDIPDLSKKQVEAFYKLIEG